jgi:AcrR family transcriptional regulator
MSPRSSAAEAARTRAAIVDRAVEVASVEGLEGVTIGGLAQDLDMSKAGIVGGFGSKEALQLAALDRAVEVFRREVVERAASKPAGLPRLRAYGAAWIDYLSRDIFPGGCFLTSASSEFDGRSGPVRDAVDDALDRWRRTLEREAATAIDAGDLPAGSDPADIAFAMLGVALALNQNRQLHRDRRATQRARRLMARTLGA